MSYSITKPGIRFLSECITGSGRRINCIYVEYGTDSRAARTQEYFRALESRADAGYVKVPVKNSYVGDDGIMHFDAMVSLSDLPRSGRPDSITLTYATLAYESTDTTEDDVLVITTRIKTPITISAGTYAVVNSGFTLGA